MSLTFPKSVRFQFSSEFLRVKTQGRAYSGRYLTLGVLKNCETTKTGLITSKRVGMAVERNRVRRRLRELMRLTLPEWVPGVWVVAIARRAAVGAPFDELRREWLHLAGRAGVLRRAPADETGRQKGENAAS